MAASVLAPQPKTKKKKFSPDSDEEDGETKSSKHVTYLKNTLGAILSQCLHEVCQKRPRDPIEFIALCLYKSVDCELYFYEKAIFSKELQLMALELKKENAVRQSNIEMIKKKIQELKILLRGDKRIEAMLWMEARKKSILMAEEEEDEAVMEEKEVKEQETVTEEIKLSKPIFLTEKPEQKAEVESDESSVKKPILAKFRKFSVKKPVKPRKKSPKLRSHRGKSSSYSPSSASEFEKESTSDVDSESTIITTSDVRSETSTEEITEEPEETSESVMTEEEVPERHRKMSRDQRKKIEKKKIRRKHKGETPPESTGSSVTEVVKEPRMSPKYPRMSRMYTSGFDLGTDVIISKSKKGFDAKSGEDLNVDTEKKKKWKRVIEDVQKIRQKAITESTLRPIRMKMKPTSPSKKPKKKAERTSDVSKTYKNAEEIAEVKTRRKKKGREDSAEDKSHATFLTTKRQSIKPRARLVTDVDYVENIVKHKGGKIFSRRTSRYPEKKDSKFETGKKSYAVSDKEDMRKAVSPTKAEILKKKAKKKEKEKSKPPGGSGAVSPDQYTLPWVTKAQEKHRKSLVGVSPSRQFVEDHKARPSKGGHVEDAHDKVPGREEKKASWHGRDDSREFDKTIQSKKKASKGSIMGSPTEIEGKVSKKFSSERKSPLTSTSPKVKVTKKKAGKAGISDTSDLEDLAREPEKPTKRDDGKGKRRHSLVTQEEDKPKKDQRGKASPDERHKILGSPSDQSDIEGEKVHKKLKKTKTLERLQEDGVAAKETVSKTGKHLGDDHGEKVGVKKTKDIEKFQTETDEEEIIGKNKTKKRKGKEDLADHFESESPEMKAKTDVLKGEETDIKKTKEDKQAALQERDAGSDVLKKKEEKAKFDLGEDISEYKSELPAKKKDETGQAPKSKEKEEAVPKRKGETVSKESGLSEDESKPIRKKEEKELSRKSKRRRESDVESIKRSKDRKGIETDTSDEELLQRREEKKKALQKKRESDESLSMKGKDRGKTEEHYREEELDSRKKKDAKRSLPKEREEDEDLVTITKDKGKFETEASEEEAHSKKKKVYKKSVSKGKESDADISVKSKDSGKYESDFSEEEAYPKKKKGRESDESLSTKGKDKGKVEAAERGEVPYTKKKIDEDIPKGVKGKFEKDTGDEDSLSRKKKRSVPKVSDEDVSSQKEDRGKTETDVSEEEPYSRKKKDDRKSLTKERQVNDDISKQGEDLGKIETDSDTEAPHSRKKKDDRRTSPKEREDKDDTSKQREEKGKYEIDTSEEEPYSKKKEDDRRSLPKERQDEEDASKQREERGKYETAESEEEPYSKKKKIDKKLLQKGRDSNEDVPKDKEEGRAIESDAVEEKTSKARKKHRHKERETDDDQAKQREGTEADDSEAPGAEDEDYARKKKSVKKSISQKMEDEIIDKDEEKRKDEEAEDSQFVSEDKKKKKEKLRERQESADDTERTKRKVKKDEAEDWSEDEVAKEAGKPRHDRVITPDETGQSLGEEETKKRKHEEKQWQRKHYDDDESSYDGSTRQEAEKDRESLKHRRKTKKLTTEDTDDSDILGVVGKSERRKSFQRYDSPDQTQKSKRHKDRRADEEDLEPDRGTERRGDRKKGVATPDKGVDKVPGSQNMSIPVIGSVDVSGPDEEYDDSQDERGRGKKKKSVKGDREDGEERQRRDRRFDSEDEDYRRIKSEEEDSFRDGTLLLKKKSSFLGAEEDYSRSYSMSDGKKYRKKRVSKMFTPIQCEWYLDKPRVLVCRHPILGEIRSHQPILYSVLETPNFWDHENFNCRVFYEHEIYSVCDPRFDDAEYKDRMMEWHEEDWAL